MIEMVRHNILPAAMALLPGPMESPLARRLLLAIGFQESKFLHRRQVGGPARGFWQFEKGGGVVGVMVHPQTAMTLQAALHALRYPVLTPDELYHLIEHNDVAACVLARLLLWSDPRPLPDDQDGAWALYLRTWRPGRPHPEAWPENWERAT